MQGDRPGGGGGGEETGSGGAHGKRGGKKSKSKSSGSSSTTASSVSSNAHPELSLTGAVVGGSGGGMTGFDTSHLGSVIQLDVGGLRFSTTLSTLRAVPDSMLSLMFSGRFPLLTQADGSHFIDRDGTHFRHILNYLRDGARFVVPTDLQACRELLREVEYYQIVPLILKLRHLLEEHDKPTRKMYCTIRYLPGSTYDGWPMRIEGPLRSDIFVHLNGGSPVPEMLTPNVKNIFGSPVLGWKIRGIFITKIFNLLASHGWSIDTSNGSGGGKEKNFAEMYILSSPLTNIPYSSESDHDSSSSPSSSSTTSSLSPIGSMPSSPSLSLPRSTPIHSPPHASNPQSPPLSPTLIPSFMGTMGDADD